MISLGADRGVKLKNKDTMGSSSHILNEGLYMIHSNRCHGKWKFLMIKEGTQLHMKQLEE